MEIEYARTLTRKQGEIFHAPSRYLVLVAGRRFGKTILAVAWLICQVLQGKLGALGYYVLPLRVQAKAIAWEELKRATAGLRVGRPNETELTVTLPGSRKIALKGADDPESLEGVGLTAVVLDEVARMKLSAWEKSLRPALSDNNGRALLIGKPRGLNHLHDFFLRGQHGTKRDGWQSWQYRTIDGGFVSQADVDEARRDLPPKIFRQEYEANFETLAGRIFDEFSAARHVVEPVDPRAFSRGAIGIDWGWTHPFAAEAIGESGGRKVVCAEVFRSEMQIDAIEAELIKMRDRCPGFSWHADPSRPDLIREFSDRLGVTIEPANNDVDEGILEVSKALHFGEGREPSLFVSRECPALVQSIDSYVWESDREGNPRNKPLKIKDDAVDAARYAVMALAKRSSVGTTEGNAWE